MSDTPTPPEGYRLLEPGEKLQPGDIVCIGAGTRLARWESSIDAKRGYEARASNHLPYARRTEPLEPGKWYRVMYGGKMSYIGQMTSGRLAFETEDEMLTIRLSSEVIGPWVDDPTDAEIAQAVRWYVKRDIDDQPDYCICISECRTPRQFVDAVNQYRKEHE